MSNKKRDLAIWALDDSPERIISEATPQINARRQRAAERVAAHVRGQFDKGETTVAARSYPFTPALKRFPLTLSAQLQDVMGPPRHGYGANVERRERNTVITHAASTILAEEGIATSVGFEPVKPGGDNVFVFRREEAGNPPVDQSQIS